MNNSNIFRTRVLNIIYNIAIMTIAYNVSIKTVNLVNFWYKRPHNLNYIYKQKKKY